MASTFRYFGPGYKKTPITKSKYHQRQKHFWNDARFVLFKPRFEITPNTLELNLIRELREEPKKWRDRLDTNFLGYLGVTTYDILIIADVAWQQVCTQLYVNTGIFRQGIKITIYLYLSKVNRDHLGVFFKIENLFTLFSLFRHVLLVMFITFSWIVWIRSACVSPPRTTFARFELTDHASNQVESCLFSPVLICSFFSFPSILRAGQ